MSSSVNDPDGTISKVEFYNGTNLLNTDLSTPFEYSINPASDISYSISAKVYDDCGAVNTSNALIISTTVSCNDGVQNGNETGIDCGGSCTACANQPCINPTLISQGRNAMQSSYFTQYPQWNADRLVDGIAGGSNFNHTQNELKPWWYVDLGSNSKVTRVHITNRSDC
ncbi:MAG: hypothetical protein IPI77_19260 [Saprospiraceae bacterium]|nr:hypothetical protein [Saprospiraceae bacterium]